MDKDMLEKLKTELFMNGSDAIDDFLGFECNYDDKDVIDNLMDEVAMQMPEEELMAFYKKYVEES